MNSPTDLSIPDVQNSIDSRHLAIDKVGIKAIRHPVKVADKSVLLRFLTSKTEKYLLSRLKSFSEQC